MKTRPDSQFRRLRLAAEVRQLLSPIVMDIGQEHKTIASISETKIDDIKKGALVFISIISGDTEKFMQVLEKRKHFLEETVFHALPLPFKLDLHFQHDTGPEQAQHISEIINQNNI